VPPKTNDCLVEITLRSTLSVDAPTMPHISAPHLADPKLPVSNSHSY
jgi:hypothetical protein